MTARDPMTRLTREARASLRASATVLARTARTAPAAVAAAAAAITRCLAEGGTVYFCGNGGSAADAQHLAAEFSGRYLLERPPLAAVALTTNTSALTAIGNDYGYEQVFARQLEGLASPGDVLLAITTSGRSASITRAVETAHALGMTVIGMTGAKGAAFAARCDLALVTPDAATPRVQEGHIAMGHALCELVERALHGGATAPRRAPVPRRRTR
jgi:D-sedoheptulose 7-phosphate isomerase